jgi:hypothetical protein
VGHTHIAASIRAGSGVPFIRLGRVCGIRLSRSGIGRRTRARREGRITGIHRRRSARRLSAISLTSRATVVSECWGIRQVTQDRIQFGTLETRHRGLQ